MVILLMLKGIIAVSWVITGFALIIGGIWDSVINIKDGGLDDVRVSDFWWLWFVISAIIALIVFV